MDSSQEPDYLEIKDYNNLACAIFGGYVFALLLLVLVILWSVGMSAHGVWTLLIASVFIAFCVWFCLRDLVQKKPRILRFSKTSDIVCGESSYEICSIQELSHFIDGHGSCIPSPGGCLGQWKGEVDFDIAFFERQIQKRCRFGKWIKKGVNATMKLLVQADSFNYCGIILNGKCVVNLLILNGNDYEELKHLMLDKGVPTYRVDDSRQVVRCN
ncbi:hypothetical protein [Desulfovibrio ferrophilus]|uniref:Uncharacterized protein n=1 Tax=Desulfovibrio ferrophilus TaxID=241368 RepID=A0A2Z6B1S6_9BACT|nr:hypothetical protein [Desulfovibrio ferrophilus]BBD09444.1 uncharacterized protein DFE_2718 [Desulfovibrio ferrophilus]